MSYIVALQSAAFYFMACTPCRAAQARHKARGRLRAEREEKERREQEQPDAYHHPLPSHTNPYWAEEIMLGPHLPKKGTNHNKKAGSQRRAPSTGNGSSASSTIAVSTTASPTTGAAAAPTFEGGSAGGEASHDTGSACLQKAGATSPSVTTAAAMSEDGGVAGVPRRPSEVSSYFSDDWNHKRYQREDEELWGSVPPPPLPQSGSRLLHQHHLIGTHAADLSRTGQKLVDAIVKAGSSAGRLIEAKLGDINIPTLSGKDAGEGVAGAVGGVGSSTGSGPSYFLYHHHGGATTTSSLASSNSYQLPIRNPPVNDYHPPVVASRPAYRFAQRWMVQPPPPAKVMEGKVPAVVRRTDSAGSSVVSSSRLTGDTVMDGGSGSMAKMGHRMRERLPRRAETADAAGAARKGDLEKFPTMTTTSTTRSRRSTAGSSAGTTATTRRNTGMSAVGRSRSMSLESTTDEDERRDDRRSATGRRRRRAAAAAPAAAVEMQLPVGDSKKETDVPKPPQENVALSQTDDTGKGDTSATATHAAACPKSETIKRTWDADPGAESQPVAPSLLGDTLGKGTDDGVVQSQSSDSSLTGPAQEQARENPLPRAVS